MSTASLLVLAGFSVIGLLGFLLVKAEEGLPPHLREGYEPDATTESAPAPAVEPASVTEQATADDSNVIPLKRAA